MNEPTMELNLPEQISISGMCIAWASHDLFPPNIFSNKKEKGIPQKFEHFFMLSDYKKSKSSLQVRTQWNFYILYQKDNSLFLPPPNFLPRKDKQKTQLPLPLNR